MNQKLVEPVDEIILDYYARFGEEANQQRAIPSGIDYLKPVQRKIIEAAYNGVGGAGRDKIVKSVSIIGDAIKAHPHGDTSIYSAMSTMVQQGLLKGKGNWGLYSGLDHLPPAAARYTECKIDKNILDIIKMTFSSTEMIEGENKLEARYIPCPIPLGLINNGINTAIIVGIGVGVSVKAPCFRSVDLAKRMIDILNNKSVLRKMPWDNANLTVMDSIVKTGKGNTFTTGQYKMLNDLELCITKLPIGCAGSKILSKIKPYLDLKQADFRDESTIDTSIIIKCYTRKKMAEVEKIIKSIMKQSITFNVLGVDAETNKIKRFSIDEVLITNMLYYTKAYMKHYSEIKMDTEKKIEDLSLIDKMKPHLVKELNTTDTDTSIKNIATKLNVDYKLIDNVISNNSIKKLLSLNTDTNDLKIKLSDINNRINNPKINIIKTLNKFK